MAEAPRCEALLVSSRFSNETVASLSCCSSNSARCSASAPCGCGGGGGELCSPGCTCVLREYLTVPLESPVAPEERSHALSMVLAKNVLPKDNYDTIYNYHNTNILVKVLHLICISYCSIYYGSTMHIACSVIFMCMVGRRV